MGKVEAALAAKVALRQFAHAPKVSKNRYRAMAADRPECLRIGGQGALQAGRAERSDLKLMVRAKEKLRVLRSSVEQSLRY
jgi:hypothetical protein